MQWNGKKWQGFDVPDFPPTSAPEDKVGPFIMLPDGLGHLFALNKLADGPFPEHYEPMESPIGTNPLHPNVIHSPVVRLYESDKAMLGEARTSRMSARLTRLPNCSATGPNMLGSTPSPSHSSLLKLANSWRRKKASTRATG
jgi:hypothetical protein